jgi:hypothetical protein
LRKLKLGSYSEVDGFRVDIGLHAAVKSASAPDLFSESEASMPAFSARQLQCSRHVTAEPSNIDRNPSFSINYRNIDKN